MALFRRKPTGKHALGAAVTAIPSGPPPRIPAPAGPGLLDAWTSAGAALPPAVVEAAVQEVLAPTAPAAPVSAEPPALPEPVPAYEPVAAVQAPLTAVVPEPVDEPDVLTSIAELIASGEAWALPGEEATTVVPRQAPLLAPAPVAVTPPPAPPAPVAPAPQPVVPAPQPVTYATVVPLRVPAPVAAPVAEPASARSSLEAALAELLPSQPDATPAPYPGAHEAPAQPAAVRPASPRVQLGFRDGTSTTLDPASDQSRALEELAQSLTRKD